MQGSTCSLGLCRVQTLAQEKPHLCPEQLVSLHSVETVVPEHVAVRCVCVCAHAGILGVIKSTHTCLRPDATVNSAPVTVETEWEPDREFGEILEQPMRDGDGINECEDRDAHM